MKSVTLLLLLSALAASAIEKAELQAAYKGKYVVVLRDGLAVGTCARHPETGRGFLGVKVPKASLAVHIDGKKAEYRDQVDPWYVAAVDIHETGCGLVMPEPLHRGEVLHIEAVGFYRSRYFIISVENVAPHQTERGMGALAHRSFETARASLIFTTSTPKNLDSVAADIALWLKPFETADAAAQFGNTASGVYVKQVSAGMTTAEVEAALGPPETRVDLPDKLLYKYKDMTIQFRDGKVVDVH
jgi:hypothetical protein